MSPAKVADFYVLPSAEETAQNYFACKLTEKILHQHKHIYIHCQRAAQANDLDDLLYSFRPDSFLPHVQITSPFSPVAFEKPTHPILIGAEQPQMPSNWVVINLADAPYILTNRVAEIVIQEESAKLHSRAKFTQYKQKAFELRTHQL